MTIEQVYLLVVMALAVIAGSTLRWTPVPAGHAGEEDEPLPYPVPTTDPPCSTDWGFGILGRLFGRSNGDEDQPDDEGERDERSARHERQGGYAGSDDEYEQLGVEMRDWHYPTQAGYSDTRNDAAAGGGAYDGYSDDDGFYDGKGNFIPYT